MKNIVFLDAETIPDHIKIPEFNFSHTYKAYPFTESSSIVERAADAEIIITNKVPLNSETLAQLPKLEMIAVAATGYDVIDLESCKKKGVILSNVRGYATTSVPEHVLAMIFALKRNLFAYHNDVMNGIWREHRQFCFFNHPISDVSGSTIGVFGKGSLGEAVGKLAEAVGMKVLFAEHKGAEVIRDGYYPFEEVLSAADVISLHCPLTPQTKHMIGEKELSLMKKGAILVNAGRGGLVDEEALVKALQEGEIAGSGVDVLSREPPINGNPLLDDTIPNLLVTPHIAWGSDSAITTLMGQVVENINAYAAGNPIRQVV